MRRFFVLLFAAIVVVVLVILTDDSPSDELSVVADRVASALNEQLTGDVIDSVSSNDEAAALVRDIVRRASAGASNDLVISVYPELGGLLVDLSDEVATFCVFLDTETLDDPPGMYAALAGGCDPDAYLMQLELLAAQGD